MKLSKTLFLILIAACFTFTANTAASKTIREKTDSAKKSTAYKIIHLCGYGDICVCPSEITVKSGTTVIWINQSEMSIKIHFVGEQVKAADENHIHFRVNSEGFYVSNTIPDRSRATLSFIEKGRYNYVAKTISNSLTDLSKNHREFNGTIIVE